MEWLDLTIIEYAHERALEETGPPGEPVGYRPERKDLLLAALDRPKMYYKFGRAEALSELAAVYLGAIAKAHAFQQGNKRTALLATRAFLVMNDQAVTMPFPSPGETQTLVRRVADKGVRELGDEDSPLSLRDVAKWIEEFYD